MTSKQEYRNEIENLKQILELVLPDFNLKGKEITEDTVELITMMMEKDKKAVPILEDEVKDLTYQVKQFKTALKTHEEALIDKETEAVTLRAQIKNKTIEKEVENQVDYLQSKIASMTQLADFNNGIYDSMTQEYEALLGKVQNLSVTYGDRDKDVFEGLVSDIKEIATKVAENCKPQIVIPEMSITKDE